MWRVRMGWIETYSGGRRVAASATIDGGFPTEQEAAAFARAVFHRFMSLTYNSLPWFQTYREAA
jgi:hypothetical protein